MVRYGLPSFDSAVQTFYSNCKRTLAKNGESAILIFTEHSLTSPGLQKSYLTQSQSSFMMIPSHSQPCNHKHGSSTGLAITNHMSMTSRYSMQTVRAHCWGIGAPFCQPLESVRWPPVSASPRLRGLIP